jgi:hypothetical protein
VFENNSDPSIATWHGNLFFMEIDKSFCCCYKTCYRWYLLNLELVTFCWFDVIFYIRLVGWELMIILGTLTMFTIPSCLTMSFDLNDILWWHFDLRGVRILYLCKMVVLIVIHDKLLNCSSMICLSTIFKIIGASLLARWLTKPYPLLWLLLHCVGPLWHNWNFVDAKW